MLSAIHHTAVRVANLDEARARWSHILGLSGEREGQRALLRCAYEDFALILVESTQAPGLEYVAYELESGISLTEAGQRLAAKGVSAQEIEIPVRGSGLRLDDPDGNGVVLLERRARTDTRNPEVRFNASLPAFHPRKFGHVNYLTSDTPRIIDWYVDVLGFQVTDWIGDEGCWLHINADHHVAAFLNKGYAHIHHLAFELVDWGEMRVALDHLAQNNRHIVWGPGRHGNARNLFSYFRMPEEEMFIELFCDMEQLLPDHQVRHLPDNAHSSNTWGILPPRSYFRFDAEALRLEEDQAEAYTEKSTVI
ncbi:MAG TPA: VOC family protein [Ktedonobacteraceae bacterium]|nr:VOC family protein [Ktedonobacteraceae bacterium]